MKKIPISFIVIALLFSSLLATAGSDQINLTVKGHHNDNTRILDNNSVLFSGDSFQISVEVQAELYIYAFLIDSNNNIQQLKPPNSSSLVSKDQSISFPSDNPSDWYQLDENTGEETLIIVSSPTKLDTSQISNADQLNALEAGEVNLEKFIIRHLSAKIVTRGLDTPLTINTEEYLETPTTLPPQIIENIGLSLNNDSSTSQTILSILNDSINTVLNMDNSARGVNEIRIFEQSAPGVVLVDAYSGMGSGALVSRDGHIFTNSHVVGDAKKVHVYFMPKNVGKYSNNDFATGIIVNNNKTVDLALIKLMNTTPVKIKPLNLAQSTSLKIGQDVHAIGHPNGGSDWTYTRGYIGQLLNDHEWGYDDGINRKAKLVIQTQTPIAPGSSGGPLLNDEGLIIGVNTYSGEFAGANYAVSVNDLRLFLNEKIKPSPKTIKTTEAKRVSNETGSNVLNIKRLDYDNDGVKDMVYFLDDDDTGYIERIVIEISNSDEYIIILDYNEDGNWNEKMMNTNKNPELDFHIFDYDGDGKADMHGYDDNDDGEIDRYEKV